jgi:hypothetical protein
MKQWEHVSIPFAKENPMNTNLAKSALITFMVLSLILSACGARAPAATPTLAASATSTATAAPTVTPTVTFTPTRTPKPTATPNLAATQRYDAFFSVVQKIHDAGQISTTDGKYKELDDYKDQVADKLSYSWAETGVSAKNFIVQADFMWSSATKTTNLSGCGFIFRIQPNGDHYLIVLDAVSGIKLASSTDRGTYSMGSPSNGASHQLDFGSGPYQATFTLVVNDLQTYVYINDAYYGEYKLLDYRITDSGPLASAVLSATNEGYGTRCTMTNIRAWVIEP